jgi:hypothetical protein
MGIDHQIDGRFLLQRNKRRKARARINQNPDIVIDQQGRAEGKSAFVFSRNDEDGAKSRMSGFILHKNIFKNGRVIRMPSTLKSQEVM